MAAALDLPAAGGEPDLSVRDGGLRVPEGPGLGLVLNEAKLSVSVF